ncbi:MAG: hypothetical protein Fur0043_20810 [Anaerolineales bacterium]
MQLEKSPGFDQYKDGLPEPPPDPALRRRRFRLVLLTLLLAILALSAINFLGSKSAAILSGNGAVTGVVVGPDGQPFQGQIFILGTELSAATDANGRFFLDHVPAGAQILIVADDALGREFPIEVIPGETVEMGQIQFIPTATP